MKWTMLILSLVLLFVISSGDSLVEAESMPLTDAGVSAVYVEGRVVFRVTRDHIVATQVEVFDAGTQRLLFDSGPARGTTLVWPVDGVPRGPWRYLVKGWNASGELMLSQSALSEDPEEIWSISFGEIKGGTVMASPSVLIDGDLDVGTSTAGANINTYSTGVATAVSTLSSGLHGGMFSLMDEAGNVTTMVSADTSGTGGLLAVKRNATGSTAFEVNGNWSGTENPRISMLASDKSAVFDLSNDGNTTVMLPSDAISNLEIMNEAGIASVATDTGVVSIGTTATTIVSRSITVPSNGYVYASATSVFMIHHTGLVTFLDYGICDSLTGDLPVSNTNIWMYFEESNTFNITLSAAGTFPVIAGTHTFRYAAITAGEIEAEGAKSLNLIFVPTAYGVVDDPTPPAGKSARPTSLLTEPEEAELFHRQRLENELAEIRAELDRLSVEIVGPAQR